MGQSLPKSEVSPQHPCHNKEAHVVKHGHSLIYYCGTIPKSGDFLITTSKKQMLLYIFYVPFYLFLTFSFMLLRKANKKTVKQQRHGL